MLQWYDVWSTAFNDFMQEHGVTEKYLGLDESTIPALVRYRYYLDDRFEDMSYDYKWALPTMWAAQAVCRLLINDSSYECPHDCDRCVCSWACFEAEANKENYMSQVRSRYEDMQFYEVTYCLELRGHTEFFHNYVFASHSDNVSRILSNHHGQAVQILRNDQIISPLPIPTEERFVPCDEIELKEDRNGRAETD